MKGVIFPILILSHRSIAFSLSLPTDARKVQVDALRNIGRQTHHLGTTLSYSSDICGFLGGRRSQHLPDSQEIQEQLTSDQGEAFACQLGYTCVLDTTLAVYACCHTPSIFHLATSCVPQCQLRICGAACAAAVHITKWCDFKSDPKQSSQVCWQLLAVPSTLIVSRKFSLNSTDVCLIKFPFMGRHFISPEYCSCTISSQHLVICNLEVWMTFNLAN